MILDRPNPAVRDRQPSSDDHSQRDDLRHQRPGAEGGFTPGLSERAGPIPRRHQRLTSRTSTPTLRPTMKVRGAGRTGFFGYYFSYRLSGGPMP